MQEDLAAIKKGQQPSGVKLEKQSEESKTAAPLSPTPKITPPPPQVGPKVELGKLEKSKPLFGGLGGQKESAPKESGFKIPKPSLFGLGAPKPSSAAPLPPPGTAIKIPEKEGLLGRLSGIAIGSGGKRRTIYIAVAGVAVLTLLIFWVLGNFFDRGEVTFSPTPTPTLSPTATPVFVPIENYFSITESLNLDLGPQFLTSFGAALDTEELETRRTPGLYRILNLAGTKRYGFREIMDTLSVVVPSAIQNSVSDNDFYMTVIRKNDGKLGYGFIAKVNNIGNVKNALSLWEANMADTLDGYFKYNSQNAASTVFLDNTYKETEIRYLNFPDPNLTIDYAAVSVRNGENYLVFTNSREHIYAILDLIK